tara:strand:- start:101629 stop:104127 length:2499 start_codon:yes stop_codon:yes gene_type:complete
MKQVIEAIQNNKAGIGAEILKGATGGGHFPGGAPDGTIHTYKDGKKYKKTAGKWLPVSSGKGGGSKEGAPTPTAATPAGGKDGQAEPASKHDLAQLTHMKEIMKADPKKAYEIFQSLEPAAQHMVPQDVINEMVKASHEDASKEGASFDDLGGKGKDDKSTIAKKEPAKKAAPKKEDRGSDQSGAKGALSKEYEHSDSDKKALDSKTSKMHAKDGKMHVYEGDKKVATIDHKSLKKKESYQGDPSTNKATRKMLTSAGISSNKLGKAEYEKVVYQMAHEALVDSNYSSAARKVLAAATGDPKMANKPDYPNPSDPKFKEKQANIKKDRAAADEYENPKSEHGSIARKIATEAGWSGDDAVAALAFDAKMNGSHKLAKILDDIMAADAAEDEANISFDDKKVQDHIDKTVDDQVMKGEFKEQELKEAVHDAFLKLEKEGGFKSKDIAGAVEEAIQNIEIDDYKEDKKLKKSLEVAELHNRAEMDMIIKGGKALPIGTKRVHGGVPVEKTAKGWAPDPKAKTEKKEAAAPKKHDHAKTAAMVALKNKFISIGTNADGDYVRGAGDDFKYVQERASKDLGIELTKTNTKSLEHGMGYFFEISKVNPNGAHAQTRDQLLTLTKNINELKVQRNKLPAGSLKKQDLQARIDKLEGRFIKDKAGNKVGLRPMKENPAKVGSGVKSGSTDAANITRKWAFMKRELEGVSGKVDFVIVERDTKGLAGAQDKYRIEVHQNGKKVADMGTTPGLPQRGAKVSDNYKDTWRDHVGARWARDLSPEMQKRTLPELKELNAKMGKRMEHSMESTSRRANARELHRISSSLIRAHEMAEEANKKNN